MKWSLSLLLVYFGFYLFIVFVSLSIACGLYYLAELIEEFTVTAKRILGYTCRALLVLHLLLLIDRLPFHCLVLGFGAHISYIRLLSDKRFPFIQVSSPEALVAIAACLISSAAWLYHWHKSYYTVEYILAFMLVTTWIVPFVFFLSMAGDQSSLPVVGGHHPYSSPDRRDSHSGSGQGQKQRRGLALRIFDIMRRKRDEVLPDVMAKFPASSGLMPKEKI